MQHLLKGLTSYDETVRSRAAEKLKEIGEASFDDVAALLEHQVAKWEVVSLLPLLSPLRSIPVLLTVVNFERERSVREKEHAKKYFRIRAIDELGKLGEGATREILAAFARHRVEDAVGYYIDPQHPHLHQEVIDAALQNLRKIATPTALKLVERWQNRD